ncbi:hypothetical protein bcgnr5378_37770 [Bacillus cereus]|uniref:Uncharacterized protein n=1 Tax=Bacillus cereus TaxID=1396 RepID=A0A161TA05_BACCE|nr:hypothetical protein [Bacillus cereus]KZD71894.1 hypothetical protein B4088_0355 [Bacillus cereus]
MVNPTTTSKETFAHMLMLSGSAEVKIREKATPPAWSLFPKEHEDITIRMFKSKTFEETLEEVNARIGDSEFFVDGNGLEIYQSVTQYKNERAK